MNTRPLTHWQRVAILASLIVGSWALVIGAGALVYWMVQP